MRQGSCKRCGRCCQSRYLLKDMKLISRIALNIITFLKGKRCNPEDKCGFLRYKNKKAICQAYTRRPEFCRAYPAQPGDLIEGCGYYFTEEIK